MNFLNLFFSILVLIITIFLVKINSKNIKRSIFILLLGLLLSLFILIFPFINSGNLISKIIATIIYCIQTITFNQDLSIVGNIKVVHLKEWLYVCLTQTLFLLIPLITTTFLLSLIEGVVSKIKLFLSTNKKIYIFSQINEKTLSIASRIEDKKKTIIFLVNKDDQINYALSSRVKYIKGIKMYDEISNIKLRNIKNKEINFYLFSSNINHNLKQAIEITNKYRDKNSSISLFVLTPNNVDRVVLDSMDKGNLKLVIVNENERIVYQLLNNKPLYLETIDNKISVLLISNNVIELEFIKAITWCGQLIDYKLSITVLGENANLIEEYIKINCPELIDNYDYKFIPYNIYSEKAKTELDKTKDINYVIIANDDDNLNIEYSLFLRKYFINQDKISYRRSPIINVMIKNDEVAKQVELLKNEKNNLYNFNTFGSIKNIYYENYILDCKLETLTKEVHLSYDKSSDSIETKLKRFYEKEYFIKSSRALALHLNYKMYSILKDEYSTDEEKNILLFKEKIKDEKVFNKLMRNEHDRWVAYMRAQGYKSIDVNEIKKYKDSTNSYIHYLAQLHPCIVPFDDLPIVAKSIKKDDICTFDGYIIKNMVDILSKNLKW